MLTLKDLSAAKKFLKKMYAKDYPYYSPEKMICPMISAP
jgi:hypothetical protein